MKKLPVLLLLLAGFACLAAGIWRAAAAAAYNRDHIGLFIQENAQRVSGNPEERNVYAEGVPMEEMDFEQVHLAVMGFPAGNMAAHGWGSEGFIAAPCDIAYYSVPGGELQELIPAGTEILVEIFTIPFWAEPYGLTSYPTYTAGWRYTAPFHTQPGAVGKSDGKPYGYVRLETLLTVAEAAVLQSGDPARLEYTAQEYAVGRVLQIDWGMYSSGYYVSPDIYHEPWDGWTIGLLAAGGVLLAADGALALRGRRKAGPQSAE